MNRKITPVVLGVAAFLVEYFALRWFPPRFAAWAGAAMVLTILVVIALHLQAGIVQDRIDKDEQLERK